jgi:hypothetical protein
MTKSAAAPAELSPEDRLLLAIEVLAPAIKSGAIKLTLHQMAVLADVVLAHPKLLKLYRE